MTIIAWKSLHALATRSAFVNDTRQLLRVVLASIFLSLALLATSVHAQPGVVRWILEPAIPDSAYLAGETISVGYTIVSQAETDSADLVVDLRIKRNDGQNFQQAGNYKVCVGFDGVCSSVLTQFTVSAGLQTATATNVRVPPSANRAGRQLWVRRLIASDVNVEDSNVRSAFLDVVSSLPAGPDSISGCRLDIDGDGELRSDTDGLLINRFLSGFRGDALIANAVGTNSLRKTSAAILTYLQAQNLALNLSEPQSTTAGLAFSRYFAGLRDSRLTAGINVTTAADVKRLIETKLSYTNGIEECALPFIGLKTLAGIAKIGDTIPLITGGTALRVLRLAPASGFRPEDFRLEIEGGGGFALLKRATDTWNLTLSTPRLLSTHEKFVRIRITNLKTGLSALKVLTLSASTPTFVSTNQISPSGGQLTASSGATISFSSNTLPTAVPSSLSEISPTDARARISVQFGTDVRGRSIAISIPTPLEVPVGTASKGAVAISNVACVGSPSSTFSASQLSEPFSRGSACGMGYVWRVQPDLPPSHRTNHSSEGVSTFGE